ncbi:hypothetical protein [Sulfurisphaera ohwakuensis]|uniref:Uncharacterized protein n=1 Tax=Sulfurisphaera ohwakuensis TaxID=69656 RepID=A0A650CJ33_SULOH|nr:hypothetical protein [Sulfurisphaera ohwakuensis]MBB5253515.1 hypothetical protein [Sulfurisphaera ohwakuensis]QGR17822.1 hypothetical protein D1869_12015 [Sulfurisphaera ohwakuensis]
MVCEFLPQQYKKRLLEIANIEDLERVGYTRRAAYNAKRLRVISDDRCEKLVQTLGEKAWPIIEEALREFEREVKELKRSHGDMNE